MTDTPRFSILRWTLPTLLALAIGFFFACVPTEDGGESAEGADAQADAQAEAQAPATADDLPNGLLVSLAVLRRTDAGPKPQPARLGILTRQGGEWTYSTLEDEDSNVFHKAMVFDPPGPTEPGILTLGGSQAKVKLWHATDGAWEQTVLWEEDFGGRFSRMRDVEVGDFLGTGEPALAVATHDQGVVAMVSADSDADGGWAVRELDRKADIFVHEIEVGDLDGDDVLEIYATPSDRNQLDGAAQRGDVTRYVPQTGGEREVVVRLGDRHAKEILVTDMDGDGLDELYVVIEAVSGGDVEIRRYDADDLAAESPEGELGGTRITTLPDKLTRFLTVGDADGDGELEMVAAAKSSGLWLLRPEEEGWSRENIDRDSGGFEHAALFADLDGDGRDELYAASDDDDEIRRYVWVDGELVRETIHAFDDDLSRFTWNLMPVPVDLLP